MQNKVFSLGVDSSTFHWYTQAELCAASVMGAGPHPYQHHAPHCINFLSFPFNIWINKK